MKTSTTQTTGVTDQINLATALRHASVYGNAIEKVDVLETHISYVFLAGPFAYKVKKAVDLGFLNFRSLQARAFFCQEELRLNRRFTQSIYLDVIPITGSYERPMLGGNSPPIEYAVRMRRFPQEQLLDRLLANNQLTPGHIDQLAEKIATFHSLADIALPIDTFGTARAIQRPALENFSPLRNAAVSEADTSDLTSLEEWTVNQCSRLEALFEQRKKDGFVRECHGDLHLGNIALIDDAVTPFDCIEFNANLRWIDVMNEVAFLVMDLHDRKRPDLAQRFLNRYLEITGDYAGLPVLRFYMVYRALVRAKVHYLQTTQADIEAEKAVDLLVKYRSYIALAKSYTAISKPTIVVTHGLSGSGKSTGSQLLLERMEAIRIRSDVERKRLHGMGALARSKPANNVLYSADATALAYQRLQELTKIVVVSGYAVIVDAAFLKYEQRCLFRKLADEMRLPFFIINFIADDATLHQRVAERAQRCDDASDADIPVLEYQFANNEPLHPDELAATVRWNSAITDKDNLHAVLKKLTVIYNITRVSQ